MKAALLIEKGIDVNHMDGGWSTPVMLAVSAGGQYNIALILLTSGADHRIYKPKSNTRLIHIVVGQERISEAWTPQQKAEYKQLVKWLEDHGESVVQAKADIERWRSWSTTTGEHHRKMDAEIAQRKARVAREKRAAEPPKDND
ncbi:MAG: hypothetical protein WD851_03245 [Pirellulales bacterium]